jgi:hypothetical protein
MGDKYSEWRQISTISILQRFPADVIHRNILGVMSEVGWDLSIDKSYREELIKELNGSEARHRKFVEGTDEIYPSALSRLQTKYFAMALMDSGVDSAAVGKLIPDVSKQLSKSGGIAAHHFIEGSPLAILSELYFWTGVFLLSGEEIASENTIMEFNKFKEKMDEMSVFPVMDINNKSIVKKEFFLSLFDITELQKLRDKHPDKLKSKLVVNNKTPEQMLDEEEKWMSTRTFKDFEFYTKLFAFANNIRTSAKELLLFDDDTVLFQETEIGVFFISTITSEEHFYRHFLRKKLDGNRLRITSWDKKQLLKWLWENSREREVIRDGLDGDNYIVTRFRIFQLFIDTIQNLDKKRIGLKINTNMIPHEFVNYIEIDTRIFDEIERHVEEVISKKESYKSFNQIITIANYHDIFIRLYVALKASYSRKTEVVSKGGYAYTEITMKLETLEAKLGKIRTRIRKDLITNNRVGPTTKGSKTEDECHEFLLKMAFTMAKDLKWLINLPLKTDPIVFQLNTSHFDRKRTAERLSNFKGEKTR